MGDRETLPINHSTGSHIVHTAGGAAGGAVKGGLIGAAFWGVGLCVIGALAGAMLFTVGNVFAVATGLTLGGSLLGATLFGAAVPALIVGGAALIGAPAVGAVIGGVAGGKSAHNQVQRDRAAAHMVDAEVGAMQAQATAMAAQAQMMAQGRQGAPSTVMADSIQHDGRLAGMQQLQAAR